MVDAVVERMKANGVKTVAYIGFTDAWGDLVYDALMKAAEPEAGIKVAGQRALCAAPIASVTGQVLKIVALQPDAVMTGGAGTPGALPFLALAGARLQGRRLRPPRPDQPRLPARRRRGRRTAPSCRPAR